MPGSFREPGRALRRPRLLTFTSLFPNAEQPLHGLFVRERIRALARLCDIRVVAPVPWAPKLRALPDRYQTYARVPARESIDGLPVVHPRFAVIPGVLKSADASLMALSCARQVRALAGMFEFDVIDAHWAYPDGVAAALLGRWTGRPVAITVRGDDVNCFAQEAGRRPQIRWALRSASLVIALSSALRDAVLELTDGRARVVVIPNGIDAARFHPRDRREARRRLGLAPDAQLVVSVGRLHQSKGFPILIEAVGRLRDRFPNLRVAIVGAPDGEADATPAMLAAAELGGLGARLLLPGAQPPAALADWYAAADLFALPTSREGSPNVVLEALACGLPCVATPVGGIPDVLSDPRLGLMVPATVDGFVEGLSAALERPWNARAIAAYGAARTWTRVAEECAAHLSAVAGVPHAAAVSLQVPA
jgi:glycosyltransferase involved in cell wall biosynthesis